MSNRLAGKGALIASELQSEILRELIRNVGVSRREATPRQWLRAVVLMVRGLLAERLHEMNAAPEAGGKQVAYLSLEFLMARQLESALMALGIRDDCAEALAALGVSLEGLLVLEPDPALGNGGLGRLAACFLESMANVGVQGIGYGIRYEFGMFRQDIADGWQVEQPDDWLAHSNPWEFERSEPDLMIGFGGTVEHANNRAIWHPAESVIAIAHDMLVPGARGRTVNTLRLWGAKPVRPFDLATFNRGNYLEALAPRIRSKTVTRLLYPDDSTPEGRELRLRQEHFFASASVQDVVARFLQSHDDWGMLPEKVAIHLNDTHPALAPAELIRLLVDVHALGWERAVELTGRVFSYTNHTLMPEALEVWQAELMRRIAPRHLEIIEEVNRRFLSGVRQIKDRHVSAEQLAIVSGEPSQSVNMGRFSVLMSRRVNGVSKLHSALVAERLFADFAAIYPDRFTSITNGISQRLWLNLANPGLSALLDRWLDHNARERLDLKGLTAYAGDGDLQEQVRAVKLANKEALARTIFEKTGIEVAPDALFDVQVKRIHEYKRQLLNILGVIARWNAIRCNPDGPWAPRVVILAGKAASSYWLAKLVIKLAHDVARRINSDPETRGLLKLVFLSNYNVSLAERIMPAADLSQQISLAGTEASGTGNMKLALNGALTLGTADGANIEIAEAVGPENVFMFGLSVDEAAKLKAEGYVAMEALVRDARCRIALEQVARGDFSPDDPHRFEPIVSSLLHGGDRYMVVADFADYWRAQVEVDEVWADRHEWTRRAILNIANMGRFSADRAIENYMCKIWGGEQRDHDH